MRKFKELKCLMVMKDIKQEDIKGIIGKSQSYVTARMTGNAPWTMDDVYAICEAMDIESADIPKFFPPRNSQCTGIVYKCG